jgi:hypothetical protein
MMDAMEAPSDEELVAEGERLAADLDALGKCPLERLVLIDAAQQRQGVTGQPRRMIQDAISGQVSG